MILQTILVKFVAISMLFPVFNLNFLPGSETLLSSGVACERQAFTGSRVSQTMRPSNVTVPADYNNDGRLDIANLNGPFGTLTVQLGTGNGYFGQPRLIANVSGFTMTGGDFNNDGFADLITATRIFLGDGRGGFNAPQVINLNSSIRQLGVGDFNGDDKLDVVGVVSSGDPVVVFYGDGLGSFLTLAEPALTGVPDNYEVGDFNRDGISDLAVIIDNQDKVSVILGNRQGTFEAPVDYPLAGSSDDFRLLASGDIDNDGDPDILASSVGSGRSETTIVPLINDGAGSFTVQTAINEPTGSVRRMELFDIDSDGNLDYVSASFTSLIIRLGNGDGTFQASTRTSGVSGENGIFFEDFTGDGIRDLGFGSAVVDVFAVLPNDANGKIGIEQFPVSGFTPIDAASADFNEDTFPDVVTANSSGELSLSFGDGAGGFSQPISIPVSRTPRAVLTGDVNNDGHSDIVALIQNVGDLGGLAATYFGNGDGTFQNPVESNVSGGFILMRRPVLANLNDDQFPELIIPTPTDDRVDVYKGSSGGAFNRSNSFINANNSASAEVGDFNLDGSPDLALLTSLGIQIYLGNNGLTFTRIGTYPARFANSHIFAADFNDDGILDLVATTDFVGARGSSGFVGILLGAGDGGFRAMREYSAGRGPGPMGAADFDGDGNLDLAVANTGYRSGSIFYPDSRISVLYGDGQGDFPRIESFIAGSEPRGLVVADFNSDNRPDLVTAESISDRFTLLTNICLPAPPAALPTIGTGPDASVTETDTTDVTINVPVRLSESPTVPVRVEYYTAPQLGVSANPLRGGGGESAAAAPEAIRGGFDYRPKRGELVFEAGETMKTVELTVRGDLIDEFDEKFLLIIANATNAVITRNKTEITIVDNDDPPQISIENLAANEGDTGTTVFNLPVSLSAASEKPVSVQYQTGGGTATPNQDYVRTQGTFTIPAGDVRGVIPVTVNGDRLIEPAETFIVEISNPVNATIGTARGTGTILNDDEGGQIAFSASTYTVLEGNAFNVTIRRSGGTGGGASVRFRTAAGTATPGQDYNEVNTIVTFDVDETEKNISIPLLFDNLDEGDETVNFILEDPQNAALGNPSTAVLTIEDRDNQPTISIADASVIEGDTGTKTISFAVSLTQPSKLTVSVDFATADDTAMAGSDFVGASGTFTIPPGVTRKNLNIEVIGDLVREPDETFFVNLSNPVNAGLTDNQAVGRIINNEVDPSAGTTELVSVNFAGTSSGNSDSFAPVISDTGEKIAFLSFASDLVPNDTNALRDVFVRNIRTDETELVSINQSGTDSGNCASTNVRISGNGRFVAFTSCASNLTAPDGQPVTHTSVFVRDLETDQTRLASISSAGDQVNGEIQDISADGRYVVFTSRDQNVTGIPDTQNFLDIFVRDMEMNTTTLVTVNQAGDGPANGDSNGPSTISADVRITPDGRFVIFPSKATNLVSQPFNGQFNIFVRDLTAGTTIPVSVNSAGTELVGADVHAWLSGDGRYAFFTSASNAVVPVDTNNQNDVFRRDLQNGTNELVSINQAGDNGGNGFSTKPYASLDGRYVAFDSGASNLSQTTSDTNQVQDVYWRDMEQGITRIISINNSDSNGGNLFSSVRDISADGQNVLFSSAASNLVDPSVDSNQNFDLFLRDLGINRTFAVSITEVGTSVGNAPTMFGTLAANGRVAAYESLSTNLVSIDNPNGANDVFAFTKALPKAPLSDFDGDGRTDLSVYRPGEGIWYILNSSDSGFRSQQFGNSTDLPVAADYDGDGRTDIAVFRQGVWFVFYSSTSNFKVFGFGDPGDIPVPGDYNGDTRADLAVFRPSTAEWLIRQTENTRVVQFGAATDVPVPADYDGDGKTDIAVFRDGVWFVLQSSDMETRIEQFGAANDKPVQGDFDGDGRADLAVFRPGEGVWYVLKSDGTGFIIIEFGIATDVPLRGDFDGDGRADIAVFRDGVWYILRSSDGGVRIEQFGIANDLPIPR